MGKALQGQNRDELVISTKTPVNKGKALKQPGEVVEELEDSLRTLELEHVEVFHLHGMAYPLGHTTMPCR